MKTLIFAIRKITLILILLTLGIAVSCKEESKKEESTTNTSTSVTPKLSEDKASDSKGDIVLNPAHGELGHRCDIAIGAPLNSAPATNSDTTQSGTPVINSGEIKLNPEHGLPGHRCDVKVGDPL